MHIELSKLEWIFGFHNVTLQAINEHFKSRTGHFYDPTFQIFATP